MNTLTPTLFISLILPRLGLTIKDITGASRVSEVYYARLFYGHLLFCAGLSDLGVAELLGISRSTAYYYPVNFDNELRHNKNFREFVIGVDKIWQELNDVK